MVFNFNRPPQQAPALLSYDEVQTVFHEFGHSLHELLSQCKYRSLAGANVFLDFVELPSQLIANWVKEKEGLDLFARHHINGNKISQNLFLQLQDSLIFHAGLTSHWQISLAQLDMAWFGTKRTLKELNRLDVDEFERQVFSGTQLHPSIEGTNGSCRFSNIFADEYAAGFYSYKWAQVLDADIFELFKQKGLFHRATAIKLRESIFSKGATEHPMKLFKKFREREPQIAPLLRRDGLLAD